MGAAAPPGMAGLGTHTIPNVALTESSARNAIDAFLTIRDKYGDTAMPDASKPGATAQGILASQDVASIVNGFGFSDTMNWHETVMNVALTYGFVKDGDKRAEFDQQMAKMKNANIPPEMQKQLMASVANLRPSDSNVAVIEALIADPVYGKKLRDLDTN